MVMEKKLNLTENNRILIALVFLSILVGMACSSKESKDIIDKKKIIEEQSYKTDELIEKDALFVPDSTVNNILKLNNIESSKKFYPNISSLKLIDFLRESPVFVFSNENNEYLLTYQYEGSTNSEFSCFEIGKLSDLNGVKPINVSYSKFETESGIRLGLTLNKLIEIKGESFIRDGDVITYNEDDYLNSDFLIRHNMPAYFLECTLRDNKIEKIKFGFDYP